MAQSTEYPDLKWVPPKSWTNANRSSVQLIVIHTTEGSAHSQSAEDGAAYDARRTDGTSTHYFHDSDSTVQCVRTEDKAHTARSQGNARGIQHELCTKAATSEAGWGNTYHQAMLRRAARQCARDAKKWNIPIRHLTVAEVAQGTRGFCSHHDITRAFPQDGGSHTDPGPNFPWSQFLDMVRDEREWLDMPDLDDIAYAVASKLAVDLGNANSTLYKRFDERVNESAREAVDGFFWDAHNAAQDTAAYQGATADEQKRMRNARDILQSVIGGPTSLDQLSAKIDEIISHLASPQA
jgi:N-acetyl-anhydromuramyl-L-alanine amidase AmpD